MLRITVGQAGTTATIQLEGRLAGPWVKELKTCWLAVKANDPRKPTLVDLTEVSFIDAAGREFLAEMYRGGVQLVAVDCMTRAIVEEIEQGAKSQV
jgi:anti-anti-sigma regulatory factor